MKTESRNPFMLQNPELHYLDNAATTIVAPEVADVIISRGRKPTTAVIPTPMR